MEILQQSMDVAISLFGCSPSVDLILLALAILVVSLAYGAILKLTMPVQHVFQTTANDSALCITLCKF